MRYLFKGKKEWSHDFWMSYTDLMSGFLIIFIICSVVAYNNYSKKKLQYEQLCEDILRINPDSLMHQIDSLKYLSSLKNQISEYEDIFVETEEIKVIFDTKRGSIILTHKDPSQDLFDDGGFDVKSPLKEYLDNVYLDIVNKTMDLNTRYPNIELRIEGHTDPRWKGTPRGSDISFIKNLDLSSKRANAVYEHIFSGKGLNDEQRSFVEKSMISVGYSFSERVQSDNIDKAILDPSSRRIEFRILSK